MKTPMKITAVLLAGALLSGAGAVSAQDKAECPKPGAAPMVDGQVVKIDAGRVTVRGADGSTHEFAASADTLRDLKVGDKLQAKLRVPPGCPKS